VFHYLCHRLARRGIVMLGITLSHWCAYVSAALVSAVKVMRCIQCCLVCLWFISALEQTPDVAHVEEVGTAREDAESLKQDEADKSSAGSCNSASNVAPTLQENSAVNVNSSVDGDSVVASCSEKLQSSATATAGASLTASSTSDEKPVADADDDNPELTLLVASCLSSHEHVCLICLLLTSRI